MKYRERLSIFISKIGYKGLDQKEYEAILSDKKEDGDNTFRNIVSNTKKGERFLKLSKKVQQKTVFEEWYFLYGLNKYVLAYFLTAISLATLGYFVFQEAKILGDDTSRIVTAIVTCFLIGAIQHTILPKLTNSIYQKKILQSLVLLLVSVCISYFSIDGSVKGAKELVDTYYSNNKAKKKEADTEREVERLNEKKERFDRLERELTELEGKWGESRKQNREIKLAQSKKLLTQIEELEVAIAKKEKQAEIEHNKAKEGESFLQAKMKESAVYVAWSIEFVIFLTFVFMAWYEVASVSELTILAQDARDRKEAEKLNPPNDSATNEKLLEAIVVLSKTLDDIGKKLDHVQAQITSMDGKKKLTQNQV